MSLPQTVLFLCDYQAPYGGSFIPSLRALEAALIERGTRVVWAFPAGASGRDWCDALENEGRQIAFLGGGRLSTFCALDALIRREHIDLVHAHFGLFLPVRLLALKHPRLRAVLHVHSDFSGGARPPLLKRIAKALINGLAARRVKRVMVGAHMAAREKNALYIPNGVDFSRAALSTEPRALVRGSLGVSEDERMVLLFGWSPAVKGVDIAARAVESIEREGYKLYVVCGREMTAERMRAWLDARGCAAAPVRFLPPCEDVFSYHRAADVVLSASRSETFSYALAEALYAGRPCVMSDIPGTQWAAAYETVEVFSSGDDRACAAAIQKACKGYPPEAYARAKARVERDCAIGPWVDGVLAIYAGLV